MTYLAGNHAFLVQKLQFKFFQLCQKTKIRLTNLKYINNIFSIQVRAKPWGEGTPPLVGWNGRNTRVLGCAYNSYHSGTPFYIKRAIWMFCVMFFKLLKYAKYFLNIWTLHKELEKRLDKCTLIGFFVFIHA